MRTKAEGFSRRHISALKKSKALLRAIDSSYSREILQDLIDGNYLNVVSKKFDFSAYDDASAFAKDYQAWNLLRKFDSFPLGIDTAAVAIEKFMQSEDACRQTNLSKVRPYAIHSCGLTPESYIQYAREKIRNLLGKFDWNHVSERFSFSGGASTRLKRSVGAPFYKFQGKPETTRNNALLAVCAIWSTPLWKEQMQTAYGLDPCDWVQVVEGSRITTVAKTAETDRCIAIEPDMNMFIQKGIGSVIRSKLKSVGIDLNDQTHNQKLARVGSSTGSLTTIDLASASDSIALELVRLLLPPDWFEALCLCRSEVGILPDGTKHRFEKISSMGNGYTFELESMIFWALARSVLDLNSISDRRLGVYGDDIVIHNSCADELIELLAYTGFKTNQDKTFLSGPFRESCGKHYFYGEDVSPFYIKTPMETLPRSFWFANSVRLWAALQRDPERYQSVYEYSVTSIPERQRCFIPPSFSSEAGVWVSFDEIHPRYHKWKQAFSLKLLSAKRKRHRPNGYAAVLHWFNGAGPSIVELEKGETRYVFSKTYVSWWDTAPCGVTWRTRMA